LDKVEELSNLGISTLLLFFLKLSEFAGEFCVVFITHLKWIHLKIPAYQPQNVVLFPAYSRQEILDIILKDCPKGECVDFFGNFVKLLYDVFHVPCNDLSELRYIVVLLFPKYIEPINQGICIYI
jgi:origin recognition complex subunit 5